MSDGSASGEQLSSLDKGRAALVWRQPVQWRKSWPSPDQNTDTAPRENQISSEQSLAFQRRCPNDKQNIELKLVNVKSKKVYQSCAGLENWPMFWWGLCCVLWPGQYRARAEQGRLQWAGLWLARLGPRLGPDWSVRARLTAGCWLTFPVRLELALAGSSWLWSWTQLPTVSHIDIISDQNNNTQGTQWYLSDHSVIFNTLGDKTNTELIDNTCDKK